MRNLNCYFWRKKEEWVQCRFLREEILKNIFKFRENVHLHIIVCLKLLKAIIHAFQQTFLPLCFFWQKQMFYLLQQPGRTLSLSLAKNVWVDDRLVGRYFVLKWVIFKIYAFQSFLAFIGVKDKFSHHASQ